MRRLMMGAASPRPPTPATIAYSSLRPDGAITGVSGLDYPLGVAVNSAGKLYIAETFSMVAAGVYEPTGIAVDARGNLYIADKVNRRVLRNGFIVADQVDPAGIAADRNGYLYIADSAINRIRNAASNGSISTVVANGIDCPSPAAEDERTILFVADQYNRLVCKTGHP